MIAKVSSFVVPIIILTVLIYGIKKNVNVYDSFLEGAKSSFEIILSIFPSILAMILGVNIFINSGLINVIFEVLRPVFNVIKVPVEIIPMALMRPISGSSSLAILNNILSSFGPDSLIGRISSIIQGSTDTTFYVISLYFGSIGIKKIKYSLWVGLFADIIGIISSIVVVKMFF